MIQTDIGALDGPSRAGRAWHPAAYDGQVHYGHLLRAATPAIGILAMAAALLFALL